MICKPSKQEFVVDQLVGGFNPFNWLVVSTPLKHCSQIGNHFPKLGVKITNV